MALEHEMLHLLDQRGAQYPAEHNVGHLYEAKPELKQFYKKLTRPTASTPVSVKPVRRKTGQNKA